MRRKLVALSIGTLAVALAASGCSTNKGGSSAPSAQANTQTGVVSFDPKDSQGPAKPIDGATRGGTVSILMPADFEHLDPARNYVNDQQILMGLVARSLSTYKETVGADGKVKMTVVGDLATTPGEDVNKDCKVWKYTLKDGIKFEDGSAITSKDIAYGVARSFSPDLPEGPHYIQNWLVGTQSTSADYNKDYKGPYNGGAALPPGVTTPDDKTIVFTFKNKNCDMPFASALPMTAPVPAAKDTKADYDNKPISSGPYMISKYVRGTSLELVRNPNWDPNTDAVHTAYPDGFKLALNVDSAVINQRLVADQGDDKTALTWSNVTPEVANQVTGDVAKRVVDGATQFADYLNINNLRVTDLNVRKALNTAIDRDAVIKVVGGALAGSVLNTIESPTTAGWKDYDVFGAGPNGDVAKAKALLQGVDAKKLELVYCYANTPRRQKQAVAVKNSLELAGFKITVKPVDAASYYTEMGKKDNTCDFYRGGWGSDWPAGSTIIPPLLDGRSIAPAGNQNLSYFNNDAVNAEIDRIAGEDPSKAADDWAALDKKIMTDYAPLIPMMNNRNYTLYGSKLGGLFLSAAFGATSLNTVYVKA